MTYPLLVVFVLLAAGIATAGFLSYTHQKSQLRRTAFDELSSIAQLKASELSLWRRERVADVRTLYRNPFAARAARAWLRNPSDARLRVQLEKWIAGLWKDLGYWGVALLDSRGDVKLSAPDRLSVEPQLLKEALRARPTREPVFSDFYRADPNGKILLSLLAPVHGPEHPKGPAMGYLLLTIDPEKYLYPFIQSWPTRSPTGEALLVERQGDEVVYLNELRHRKGTALTLRLPLSRELPAADAVRGLTGAREGIDYRGERVLAAYRPVPGSPWGFVTKIDAKEVYAPLRRSGVLLATTLGALLFGATGTLLFLGGRQAAGAYRDRTLALEERDRVRTELAEVERRATAALRENEERFRAMFDNAGVGIVEVAGDDRFIRVNDRLCQMVGYPREELLAMDVHRLTAPQDRPLSDDMNRQVHDGHLDRAAYDKRYLKSDGTPLWVHVNVSAVRDAEGRWLHSIATVEDISDRKTAEEALRESEERFRATFENAAVGIGILDLQGRFIRVNKTLTSMLGYTEDELLSLTYAAITPPEDLKAERPLLHSLLAGESPGYTIEKRYLRKDGTDVCVRVTSSMAWTGDPHRISIIEDITDRKRKEEALRESEERFKAFMDNSPTIAWMKDEEGRYVYVSKTFEERFGMRSEDWRGKDDFALFPEQALAYRKNDAEVLATGRMLGVVEETRDATGKCTYWQNFKFPIRDAAGKGYVAGIGLDVTDRKHYEQELLEARRAADAASQAKSDFLANMSHEIRTPMNGIMGMTDLLLDTEPSPVQRQYLDMVKSSSESLLTVINDILDFSKIEAGKLELEEVEFEIRDTVERAVDALAFRAHQKGLELIDFVDPDIPDLYVGDPMRLRQVLLNLLSNAAKFTEEGEIVLRVQHSRGPVAGPDTCRLRVSVRDTGIGIPPERRDDLFQSFSQVDSSIRRRYGGTGLGLAISKQIVERMGGRIWFESREGQGSTFFFEVELRTAEAVPCRVQPPNDLAGLRALILDDSAANRGFLKAALESRGASVVLVERGREAVELLLSAGRGGRPFDVALLDQHLSDIDGFSVVERVRDELPIEELAILMITSEDVPGSVRRARELGAGAYIVKPVRLHPLLGSIAQVRGVQLRGGPGRPAVREGPEACQTGGVQIREGVRVLLAEDNAVNRTVVEAFLERRKVSVTSVGDGRAALDTLAAGAYDLVLMDVQMPGMDGLEATRELRRRGYRKPIVGLTAHAMKGDREKCLDAGMDDYIPKPVAPDVLFRKVARWTGAACESEPPREPPADLDKLLETLGGDRAVLRVLIDQLRETSAALLPEIDEASEAGDLAALHGAAHKLRGGLLVFGAQEATRYADELERLARSGTTEGVPAVVGELKPALERLLDYLVQTDRAA